MSKAPDRLDSKAKLKPTRESATPKAAQIRESPEMTGASRPWGFIVGAIFLGLAVLFFMGLVVASIAGYTVPDSSKWLIFIVLALTASIGSGFLGGSAAASGQINVPSLTPVKFGVTGGVAVFVITLLLCYALFNPPPPPSPPGPPAPEITEVKPSTNGDSLNVFVEFSPVTLSPQDNLYAEIAADKKFKQPEEKLVDFCKGKSSCLISFSKRQEPELWLRFVVKTPDGKVGVSKEFQIPK